MTSDLKKHLPELVGTIVVVIAIVIALIYVGC